MPTIMNNSNNIDPFKKLIKSKLADYEAKVAPQSWERLESSLFATQKTKVVRTKWLASSIAAVAAALIGVFFVFQNLDREVPIKTSDNQPTEYQTKSARSTVEESTKTLPIEKPTKIEKSTSSLIADNSSSRLLSQSKTKESDTYITNDEELITISSDKKEVSTIIIDDSSQEDNVSNREKLSEIDEETKQRLIEEFINKGNESLALAEVQTSKAKRKSRNSVSLVGQSGLTSSQYTNTLPNTLRTSVSETYGNYTLSKMQAYKEEEEIKSESETTHNQPVSFGLLTSFSLTPKLQIETGVVYTYLSSETKNTAVDYHESEKMHFHYLGIPVNLNYTLFSVNRIDIFATAGAMIEKDIYGKKIKQQNPQFSVAGGLGITYPIYDKANLFGKVGGRYYIDTKNDYKTYYSDEKFGLDIQLGLKFNF